MVRTPDGLPSIVQLEGIIQNILDLPQGRGKYRKVILMCQAKKILKYFSKT
jgi:hypothetical protein